MAGERLQGCGALGSPASFMPGPADWLRRLPVIPWPTFHGEPFVVASGLGLGKQGWGLHLRSECLPGRAWRGRRKLGMGPTCPRSLPGFWKR